MNLRQKNEEAFTRDMNLGIGLLGLEGWHRNLFFCDFFEFVQSPCIHVFHFSFFVFETFIIEFFKYS